MKVNPLQSIYNRIFLLKIIRQRQNTDLCSDSSNHKMNKLFYQ